MLQDDIRAILKACEPDIQIIKTFWQSAPYERRLQELHAITQDPSFWEKAPDAQVLKEREHIQDLIAHYTRIIQTNTQLQELLDLCGDDDQATLESLKAEALAHQRAVSRFKTTLLLDGPDDRSACFVSINSGAGGTESQDWAEMLLRMYVRFCERERWNCQVLDMQTGEGAGIKSATLYIKGGYAYGLLKNEQGIHRLVRISPYDANKRRHTSFAGVFVTPEVTHSPLVIKPEDLRIDTFRAGGAGGQHVNKTESAVRITHIPTNIVAQCQNERSQTQNKETAMKMLMARLVQKQKDEEQERLQSIERKKIEWGSQIRSYVLHPYKMVKDHRTEFESPQPELVLDGDIMDFIQAELIRSHTQN